MRNKKEEEGWNARVPGRREGGKERGGLGGR
jgi:hypothetical protein